jgi:hypothetical protein
MITGKKSIKTGFWMGGMVSGMAAVFLLFTASSCEFEGSGGRPGGCETVAPGLVKAGLVYSPFQLIGGRSATGKVGDYKLQNSEIAVIISHPDHPSTFLPFGGYLVDAAPTDEDGCPLPEDHFGEIGMVVGNIDFIQLENSSLRGFAPSTIEIISTGAGGGPAVVRVRGTDAWIPIIETAILMLVPGQPFSVPLDLDIYTDYILEPDSNVVRMVSVITNTLDSDTLTMGFGEVFQFGDGMATNFPDAMYQAQLSQLVGDSVWSDILFLTSSDGRISYAFGLDNQLMASTSISNVTPALNQDLINQQYEIGPLDSATYERYLAVVRGDANRVAQEFYPLWSVTVEQFSGMVTEQGTGVPVEGAVVELYNVDTASFTTDFMTGPDGMFGGLIPPGNYEAFVLAEARIGAGPISFTLPPYSGLSLQIGKTGHVSWDVRGDTGSNIPAKLTFFKGGVRYKRIASADGTGTEQILPGAYDVVVSHGLEYTYEQQAVLVPEGGDTVIVENLTRVVDTTGFVAGDFHLHSEPSPDSEFPLTSRISDCLAEGLEIAVATDHDIITDYRPTIQALGVADKIVPVSGEEVSSPVLGHFNGYPLNYNPTARANGAIDWFLMSSREIFDALRGIGAKVVQVNHPREESSGYFNAVLYNRNTGLAEQTNPQWLGLEPGDTILSFDFNALEVINGGRFTQTFINPGDTSDPEQGTLQDWFSLLNLGFKITATGNSDSHNDGRLPGMARNYVASSTDDPALINKDEIFDAVQAQQNVVSLGAFIRFDINNTAGLGETVFDADTVDLNVQVQSAPWVDVTKVVIFANCSVVEEIDIIDQVPIVKFDGTLSYNPGVDTWYVVMAMGSADLGPVAPGFDDRAPRAFTNPIYVDVDGGGFDPPGLPITCNSIY